MMMRLILSLSLLFVHAQAITFTMSAGAGFVGSDGTGTTFEVSSYSFTPGVLAAANTGAGTGLTPGKPQISAFSFTKSFDSASFPLYRAILTGRSLGTVVLTSKDPNRQGSQTTVYTFTGTFITQIGTSANNGDPLALETFQLVFQTIRIDYTPSSGGKIVKPSSITYDVARGVVQ
ncbi:BQ2448_6943 [Microbotryum intermedium]|uniref:BQ2448_6943 protein n=1 Tax=Microbotryum intermedium TaxID=269621 RepID=A0A238FP81_9BASI|nr:BQ2448_6943 [Microbotryum intermedium]